MAVVQFAAGDKDYIDKLNLMSQQAGDVQQAKTDTNQYKADTALLKQDVLTLKNDTENIKQQTQAIAVGDLNWQEVLINSSVQNGDRLQVKNPDVEIDLTEFENLIQVGHWFVITNDSLGASYLKSTLTLSVKGELGSVSNGDRFVFPSGSLFHFRAISTTELKVI